MEEKRPGEYYPVFENDRGSYIFNSKDLNMIAHIPDLIEAGVDSLKIEGRMKTELYVATVTRTYKMAFEIIWRTRQSTKEIFLSMRMRYESAHTGSTVPDFITRNRQRKIRFTGTILIRRGQLTSER